MGRSPEEPVTGEVARELCQRVGSKAMLAGSISALGNEYVIGLNAINCATGDTLVAQQARASGKGEVLKALDRSALALRTRLGESLASVQKFATPIDEATTSSLEAPRPIASAVGLASQRAMSRPFRTTNERSSLIPISRSRMAAWPLPTTTLGRRRGRARMRPRRSRCASG